MILPLLSPFAAFIAASAEYRFLLSDKRFPRDTNQLYILLQYADIYKPKHRNTIKKIHKEWRIAKKQSAA